MKYRLLLPELIATRHSLLVTSYSLLIFILLASSATIHAQSLTGMAGLVSIPIANEFRDGEITLGVNYFDKSYNSFSGFSKDGYSYNFTLNFIPEIEFGGKISRNVKEGINQGIGDRTISLRIRPLFETEYFPAVVIGWQNIGTAFGGERAVHQHSLFIVASKSIKSISFLDGLGLHLGFGTKLIDSMNNQFQGAFGGVKLDRSIFTKDILLSVMAEYDAKTINPGFRLKLLNAFYLSSYWLDMKYFCGGGGVSWGL